jgi:hypothetical protein
MNNSLKTVLLTILTISVFVIAMVEISGVSSTALFNKYGVGNQGKGDVSKELNPIEQANVDAKMAAMPKTTIEFETTKLTLGNIKEGDKVRKSFKFKNTGTAPLLISNVVASCGCTVPSYPKEPVAPGASGEITFEFNSKGREGHQQKNLLVTANIESSPMSIGFEAEVVK